MEPVTDPPPAPRSQGDRVQVRLFAALREAMGWSELVVAPLPPKATPQTLWHLLGLAKGWQVANHSMVSGLTPPCDGDELPQAVRVAINQRFATPHTPLNDGDELAFLPPITGG